MLLVVAFLGSMAIFTAAILLVGRSSPGDKQLEARFIAIRSKRSGGLAVADGGLLKAAAPDPNALERLLTRLALAKKFQLLLTQASSKTTAKRLLLTCLLAAGCTAFAVLIFVPNKLVALGGGVVGGYIPVTLLVMKRGRRINAFNKVLPDAIEMMGRSLRAGYSPIMAIGIIAENAPEPARTEFAEVFRQQNFGLPLRDALMQMLDRVPSADLRVFVTGVLVQKDTGGNLAEILDRIVAVIRERLKIQGEIRTHTAQGRLTGWILCLMPVFMLLAINMVNPGYSKALTDNPLGRKLLYAGMGLLAVGAFLIRKIVSSVEV